MFKRKTTAETAQRVLPFSRVLANAPMTRADEVSTINEEPIDIYCQGGERSGGVTH